MSKYITMCVLLSFLMASSLVRAELSLSAKDQAALEVGRQIQAIQESIQNPKTSGAINAIKVLGNNTNYYTLVRGWLSYQLLGDQDILNNTNAETTASQIIKDRIAFLQRSIRAIDLE